MKVLFPLVALIAAISLCFQTQPTTSDLDHSANSGYLIGDQAEDFQLKNYDGRVISLSDYQNVKGYIVVFTSNHCPYAEAYEDRLISLHNQFAHRGFPLIAINPNAPEANPEDNANANREKALKKKFPFPYLSDSLQQVFPKFGATRTPHVFILDADRIVKYSGTVDNNAEIPSRVTKTYIIDALNRMLNGMDPSPSITKTVGCKIRLVPRDSTGKVILD